MCPIRSTDFLRRKGLLGLAIGLLLAGTSQAAFITFSVGGSAATSSIQSTVDRFALPWRSEQRQQCRAHWPPVAAKLTGMAAVPRRPTSNTSPLTTFTNTRGSTMTTAGTGFLANAADRPGADQHQRDLFDHVQHLQPDAYFYADRKQRYRCHVLRSRHERRNAGHGRWIWRGV